MVVVVVGGILCVCEKLWHIELYIKPRQSKVKQDKMRIHAEKKMSPCHDTLAHHYHIL